MCDIYEHIKLVKYNCFCLSVIYNQGQRVDQPFYITCRQRSWLHDEKCHLVYAWYGIPCPILHETTQWNKEIFQDRVRENQVIRYYTLITYLCLYQGDNSGQ